jgi:multimeric flavodoxin WrbA
MKRILTINASSRPRANTHAALMGLAGLAAAPGDSVNHVDLSALTLSVCRGCYGCEPKGRCIIDDDFQGLFDSMIGADVIIFGTPVYIAKESALASIFFERCKAFLSHTEAEGAAGESMYRLYRRVRQERGNAPVMPVSRLPRGKTAHLVVTQYQAHPFENVMNLAVLIFTLLGTQIGVEWFASECLEPRDLSRRIESEGLPTQVLGQFQKP